MKRGDRYIDNADAIWIFEKRIKNRNWGFGKCLLRLFCLTGPKQGNRREISLEGFRNEFRKAGREEIEEAFQKFKPRPRILGADGKPFDGSKAKIIQV